MPRKAATRVNGPYRHGRKWRVNIRHPDGTQIARGFDTEAEAKAAIEGARAELDSRDLHARAAALQARADEARAIAEAAGTGSLTVEDLLDKYLDHMRASGGKPGSVETTDYRIRALLRPVIESSVHAVTPTRAADLYTARAAECAGDTHRNALGQVKTMWKWARKAGHVGIDAWAEVAPTGTRSPGKEQLRQTEARTWYRLARERAADGDVGALGALCALVLGYRASEVVGLTARDIDVTAALAYIGKGKTAASTRTVEIPDWLCALLDEHIKRIDKNAKLFPYQRDWPRQQVHRICDLAGVPRVSAHSMRGLHGSTAIKAGRTALDVSQQLGHTSPAVTRRHYIAPGVEAAEQQRQLMEMLDDDK